MSDTKTYSLAVSGTAMLARAFRNTSVSQRPDGTPDNAFRQFQVEVRALRRDHPSMSIRFEPEIVGMQEELRTQYQMARDWLTEIGMPWFVRHVP